jgi:hypothetical protein
VTSDAPDNVSHAVREAYDKYVREPAVTSQIWQRNCDGKKVLLAVNASLTPANASFSNTGIPDGVYNGITVSGGAFSCCIKELGYIKILF